MIGRVRAHYRRPEKGWDPIPAEYAHEYAAADLGGVVGA